MIKSLIGVSIIAGLLALSNAYLLVSIGEEREQCNTRMANQAAKAQRLRADAIEEEQEKAAQIQEQLQAALDEERERRQERVRELTEREQELRAQIESFETQEAIAWQQVKLPDEVLHLR